MEKHRKPKGRIGKKRTVRQWLAVWMILTMLMQIQTGISYGAPFTDLAEAGAAANRGGIGRY